MQFVSPNAWRPWLAVLIAVTAVSAGAGSSSRDELGTLYLKNGDYLPGRPLASSDAKRLRWHSPSFREPISFDLSGVDRALFEGSSDAKSRPSSRLTLWNGNLFYGQVVAMDEQTVVMQSERHGTVRFLRWALQRIDGLGSNAALLVDGLTGLTGWRPYGEKRKALWKFDDGQLSTDVEYASIYRPYDHDGPVVLEAELSAKGPPKFLLALGIAPDPRKLQFAYSLEVWDSQLVAHRQAGEDFKFLAIKLPEISKRQEIVKLEVYLDPRAGRVLVYSQGQLRGEFKDTTNTLATAGGLMIRNTGKSLSISRLRLNKWDGRPPENWGKASGRIRLGDGAWLQGEFVGLDRATGQLRVRSADGEKKVGFADVDVIQFAPPSNERRKLSVGDVHVEYHDGSVIKADLIGVDQDGLQVRSGFAQQPFRLGFAHLRKMEFRRNSTVARKAQAANGILEFTGCRLHGRVVDGGQAGVLRWNPVHSPDAVSVNLTRDARITFDSVGTAIDGSAVHDELYLTNGDVIPCELVSMDDKLLNVRFASGATSSIARGSFKAIRLNPRGRSILEGFGDAEGWVSSRFGVPTFEFNGSQLQLTRNGFVGRDLGLPTRAHISFDAHWMGDGTLAVGIGGTDPATAAKGQHYRLLVTRHGEKLTADGRIRNPRNPRDEFLVFQNTGRRPELQTLTMGVSRTAHIDILIDRATRDFRVVANGRQLFACQESIGTKCDGGIVTFGIQDPREQSKYLYARQRPRTVPGNVQPIRVQNLLITSWPGALPDDNLERILTRRPGIRPSAVSHVLRAFNGDTLRGHLVGLNQSSVTFRSRLSSITFPRDKVAEIVSLQNVTSSRQNDESLVTAQLHGGGMVTLRLESTDESSLSGVSPIIGEFVVPWSTVFALQVGGGHLRPEDMLASWTLREPTPPPSSAASGGPVRNSTLPGTSVADLELDLLSGDTIALSQLRGKILILDFWATWCAPCAEAVPKLIEMSRKFDRGKVVLIGVNQMEQPTTIRQFVADQGWQLNVALDIDGKVSDVFGVDSIPRTVIIDTEGKVSLVHAGLTPNLAQSLEAEITRLLSSQH